jgi:hypothetical protein
MVRLRECEVCNLAQLVGADITEILSDLELDKRSGRLQ